MLLDSVQTTDDLLDLLASLHRLVEPRQVGRLPLVDQGNRSPAYLPKDMTAEPVQATFRSRCTSGPPAFADPSCSTPWTNRFPQHSRVRVSVSGRE